MTNHKNKHSKRLGQIFAEVSINDAARAAVNAARLWGGAVVVTMDDAGMIYAWAADTTESNAQIERDPSSWVCFREINNNTAASRTEMMQLIAEDIQVRNNERMGARVAA